MDTDVIFERRRAYRANIPDLHNGAYKRTYDKAMTGKSPKAGIKAKCQGCSYWQSAEVRDCLVPECPLWPYRPYQKTT